MNIDYNFLTVPDDMTRDDYLKYAKKTIDFYSVTLDRLNYRDSWKCNENMKNTVSSLLNDIYTIKKSVKKAMWKFDYWEIRLIYKIISILCLRVKREWCIPYSKEVLEFEEWREKYFIGVYNPIRDPDFDIYIYLFNSHITNADLKDFILRMESKLADPNTHFMKCAEIYFMRIERTSLSKLMNWDKEYLETIVHSFIVNLLDYKFYTDRDSKTVSRICRINYGLSQILKSLKVTDTNLGIRKLKYGF